MKSIKHIGFLLILSALIASCSPRIVGTWNIEKYEEGAPGEKAMTLSNIGTITFNRDGSGEKDVRYRMMGLDFSDQQPFTWQQDDKTITIDSEGESEFAKTWIIMESKGKVQRWKSTDGSRELQRIELRK
jgi:hypothetical protein